MFRDYSLAIFRLIMRNLISSYTRFACVIKLCIMYNIFMGDYARSKHFQNKGTQVSPVLEIKLIKFLIINLKMANE
jgi:hypothetical protein